MRQGFSVPNAYIVPVERFCREMGPALGINLAEFEFPAYFNYFVRQKRCTLVVDSLDAEHNIRRVFGETLLGPGQFRDHSEPKPNEDEDFDPSFPREARPNFYKEFYHFRTAEKSTEFQELTIDTLLEFCHFKGSQHGRAPSTSTHEKLGVPPTPGASAEETKEDVDDRLVTRRYTYFDDTDRNVETMDDSHRLLIPDDAGECEEAIGGGLRRSMSDPDLRKVTIDDMVATVPPSPVPDVPEPPPECAPTTAGARRNGMPRRSSIESQGSCQSRGGRSRGGLSRGGLSRDGMSWASGASFMLVSDDEEDPSRNSWMYSQAKWLGTCLVVPIRLCNYCLQRLLTVHAYSSYRR